MMAQRDGRANALERNPWLPIKEKTMKVYTIEASLNTTYPRIVIATSFLNPFDELTAIERALDGFRGNVLFDLLCAVGPNANRFVVATFDGTRFVLSTMKPVIVQDAEIHALLIRFYTENPLALKASVLSRFHQWRLSHGALLG